MLNKVKYWILGICTALAFSTGIAYAVSYSNAPTIQRGDLQVATSTTQMVRLPAGATGTVLSIVNGIPKYVATSTLGFSTGGSVTSVDMTVPAGLAISGNPVTTSGTLALSLQAGYNIPLTASTTNWNGLYNNVLSRLTVATGTAGSIFNISTSTNSLTINLPIADATHTGQLSNADFVTFNAKQNALTFPLSVANGGTGQSILSANYILFGNGTNGVASSSLLNFTNSILNSSSTLFSNSTSSNLTATNIYASGQTPAYVAFDPNGKLIATTTPTGGSPAGSSGQIQFNGGSSFAAGNYFNIATTTGIVTLTLGDTSVYADSVLKMSHQGAATNGFISIVDPVGVGSGTYTITLPSAAGTLCTTSTCQATLTNPVTGTGAASQLTFWSSGSAVTGSANLLFNSGSSLLTLNGTFNASSTLVTNATSTAESTTSLFLASNTSSWLATDPRGKVIATSSPVNGVTGSGNIASSGGTSPNITFTGTLPIANGGTASTTLLVGNLLTSSATAPQVAYTAAPQTIGGSANFLWNNSSNLLTIGGTINATTSNLTNLVVTNATSTVLAVQGATGSATSPLTVSSSSGTSILTIFPNGGLNFATSTISATTTAAFAGQYYSAEFNNGTVTGSTLIDWGKANTQNINASSTSGGGTALSLTFANYKPGGRYLLLVTQGGVGNATVSWPSLLHWPGATAPTLTTTAGQVDIITLVCGLTNCYGGSNLNYLP